MWRQPYGYSSSLYIVRREATCCMRCVLERFLRRWSGLYLRGSVHSFYLGEPHFAALGHWCINNDRSVLPIPAISPEARCRGAVDPQQSKQHQTISTNWSTAEPAGGICVGALHVSHIGVNALKLALHIWGEPVVRCYHTATPILCRAGGICGRCQIFVQRSRWKVWKCALFQKTFSAAYGGGRLLGCYRTVAVLSAAWLLLRA